MRARINYRFERFIINAIEAALVIKSNFMCGSNDCNQWKDGNLCYSNENTLTFCSKFFNVRIMAIAFQQTIVGFLQKAMQCASSPFSCRHHEVCNSPSSLCLNDAPCIPHNAIYCVHE
uniref:Uncharacterized protein n=1 Tax=Glossina pallidipes TaxID=7398 RepID=A0A1B0AJ83_GLOPL